MTTINFTNSLGYTTSFTNNDLDLILTELTSQNSSYASGQNQIAFVMLGAGYLLLMDLNPIYNKKMFELYSFSASNLYPFQLKLTHDNNATTVSINDALIAVGYAGTTPIASLGQVYMQLYIQSGSNISVYSKTEVDALILALIDNAPANLDTLAELATALSDLTGSEQSLAASLLLQIQNKLNISNHQFIGNLTSNGFSVDASGNVICNNATFNGSVNGLTIAGVSGLQTQLNTFQPTITNNSLNIANITNLQSILNGLQPLVINDSLNIASISGLQSSLNVLQPTLTTNSIPISYVSGLQPTLDSKQPTITTNSLEISTISGLTNSLNNINLTFSNYHDKTYVDGSLNTIW